ncbi:MAG: response regulator, partial [Algicola sp.]|nr:response regulator [Algicola sp.]
TCYDPLNNRAVSFLIFKSKNDVHGNLWLGSSNGVFILPRNKDGLSAIVRDSLSTSGKRPMLHSLDTSKDNKLLTLTNSALHQFDPTHGTTEILVDFQLTQLAEQSQIQAIDFSGIYHHFDERFYLCNSQRLYRFNRQTKRFVAIDNSQSARWCADFALQDETTLWIASQHDGLSRFDLPSEQLTALADRPSHPINQFSKTLMALHLDDQRRLWIGSADKGLAMMAVETGVVKTYSYQSNKPNGLPGNMINDIVEDNQGYLWLATFNGLSRFDPKNQSFRNFHIKNGLSSEQLNRIIIDAQGDLWVSSQNGINVVNPDTFEIRSFFQSDGLWENEFNIPFMTQDNDGRIYVGGLDAIVIIKPLKLKKHNPQYRNFIASITVDNQHRVLQSDQALVFDTAPARLGIDFGTSNYFQAHKIQFRYRMKGLEQQWQNAGNTATADYSNLPYGDYSFEVQGKTRSGQWITPAAFITLTVKTPWYLTYHAFVMYLLIFIGFIYLLLYLATQRQQQKARKLQRQVDSQTVSLNRKNQKITDLLTAQQRLFVQLSHEIRTPLTLIFAPWQKLQHQHKKEYEALCNTADHNQKRLLLLLDQLMDIAQNPDPMNERKKPIAVADAIRWACRALAPLVTLKQQQISLQINEAWIEASPDAIEKVLLNLLVNAHKYTPEQGNIKVKTTIDEQQQWLTIEVIDNGVGIELAQQTTIFECFERLETAEPQQGSGVGLALVKQLVLQNNGTIKLHSNPGQGSCFTLGFALLKDQQHKTYQPPGEHLKSQIDIAKPTVIEQPTLSETDEQRPTILVVEDNVELQLYLKDILMPDYHVIMQSNGKTGLDCAIEQIPDIVISDIMMPVMDGFELLEAIKSHPVTNHIPVILLSAKTDFQSVLTGLTYRADDYIRKPFNYQLLRLKVSNLLHLRDMWHQHAEQTTSDTISSAIVMHLNQQQQQFMDQLTECCQTNYHNSGFSLDDFAKEMAMSKRQLQRKVKALSGTNPLTILKDIRLQKARQAIEQGEQITQVAYTSGFNSYEVFARAFKEKYQHSPKNYRARQASSGLPK